MCRNFGIEIAVLASPPAVVPVGCRHVQHRDASFLHGAQQPRAIAARAFDADALKAPEGPHPGEHLAIPLPGGREAFHAKKPVNMVDDRGDVQILVGIDTTDNERIHSHGLAPSFRNLNVARQEECRGRTVTRPDGHALLGSPCIFEAKPHWLALRMTDRSTEGHASGRWA